MSKTPRLTLKTVAELSGGTILSRGDSSSGELLISEVGTDSRGAFARRSLFVALKGERFDGHGFVKSAHRKGAAAAMVSRKSQIGPDDVPGMALIQVDDTLAALQRLAAGWRALFEIPVVGITGSNGKTVVKDMLSSILAQERTVYRSPGSYNSQIGVALSLLGIRAEHEVAVIEAGISRVGEMARLEAMIRPTLGVITNIGLAHAAGLGDLETTAREKLRLFEHFDDEALVVPADCEPLNAFELPGEAVEFAVESGTAGAAVLVEDVEAKAQGFDFTARFADQSRHEFSLNIPGRHNLENAAAAIAAAGRLGASVESMRRGLAGFELSPLRLEMHTTQGGITFINDAYSSDPTSARAALSVLKHYAGEQRTVAILGDMLDLGARSAAAHADLGRIVAHSGIDRLICFGERAEGVGRSAVDAGFDAGHVRYVAALDDLNELLEDELVPGDVVLFKASRSIGLERAAERLLESVAPARLRVDLDAIRENFHALQRRLGPDSGVIAVVKSFGYGNDATRVSQTLAREGVAALAVAYADEGIPLRKRGLSLPILVTNALASEADKLVKYELTPFVYSMQVVEALCEQAQRCGARGVEKRVSVHLEVDTGMNRVGLKPGEVVDFARRVAALDQIEIAGVMTHLAAADDPAEDAFTREQLRVFRGVLSDLRAAGVDPGMVHAANTAGAWRFAEARFDAVRVGLGLYGLSPSAAVGSQADGTRSALEFSTRVIHLKEVAAGESVGYNRTWFAESARRIATIAVGYNDGFPRFMSNGGEVLVGGVRCPVVGNVCMDVSMVDVTDVDDVQVGDEVVIFGRQGSEAVMVEEIARRGGTISYEVLCNISTRVRRIFVRQ
jgi:alanine racemase